MCGGGYFLLAGFAFFFVSVSSCYPGSPADFLDCERTQWVSPNGEDLLLLNLEAAGSFVFLRILLLESSPYSLQNRLQAPDIPGRKWGKGAQAGSPSDVELDLRTVHFR